MKTKNILVAEDDADDRFLLQSAFEQHGLDDELLFVENGVEVLAYLDTQFRTQGPQAVLPGLIMLDLNMPKKDGREVLRDLKSHEVYRRIPVVVFSTTGNVQEMLRCYQLGANAYITKPNNYNNFLEIVDHLHNYWIRPIYKHNPAMKIL